MNNAILATFGAAAASIRAFFHFTYAVAIRGALFTDFAAQPTRAFVKFRADQHEMRGGSVPLPSIGTSTYTIVNAAFHLGVDHRHRIRSIYNRAQTRSGTLRNESLLLWFPRVSQKGLRTLKAKAR
jgi:hypothetical protein